LFLGAAALVLGLAFTGTATAGYHGNHGRPYYATAGVKFSGGYYYRGFDHHHWGGRVWNARYGRYHYWDPYLRCYYYWAPGPGCFFPVGAAVPF
jgi:hypothetical protein